MIAVVDSGLIFASLPKYNQQTITLNNKYDIYETNKLNIGFNKLQSIFFIKSVRIQKTHTHTRNHIYFNGKTKTELINGIKAEKSIFFSLNLSFCCCVFLCHFQVIKID